MKILIAPDKFKGSLSAREVAENIAAGLRDVLPDAKIDMVPMADGGEGTAEVIGDALDGSWVNCDAHDPLGRQIDARYAWIEHRKLAVMEMSEAAGMRRFSGGERDPLRANTFGVGEMLLDALQRGAHEIVIGLGGSATNDGGFGMARALGFRFFSGNDHDHELSSAISETNSKPAKLVVTGNYCGSRRAKPIARKEWSDASVRSAKRRARGQNRRAGARAHHTRGCCCKEPQC